ncbi:MAG: carbonic anhydrase [Gordonia sp. (in: high G+C Gram-positive bacteria)]
MPSQLSTDSTLRIVPLDAFNAGTNALVTVNGSGLATPALTWPTSRQPPVRIRSDVVMRDKTSLKAELCRGITAVHMLGAAYVARDRSPRMSVLPEVLASNAAYAEAFGEKAELALPPARGFAILTCMDARLDPAKYAGLAEGDAHVIRNAGGRASDDAIRSLVISYKLLGTKEWFVIHHSDCGMEFFTDEVIRGLLANSLETAELRPDGFHDVGAGPGSREGDYIDWLTIGDQAQSVHEDVRRIKAHPLVPADIPVYGYIYDVKSGRLIEVPAATEAGRPAA